MIAQIIGFIGFAFLGISNLSNKRKNIVLFQIVSSIFFSIHYYMINAITASILNVIGIFRGITFYNKDRDIKLNNIYLSMYIFIYVVIGLYTYDSVISLLPVIAYILYTISIFNDKEIYIKLINILVSSLWLVYDFIYKSYAGIISDTLMIITLIIGIYILNINRKIKIKK